MTFNVINKSPFIRTSRSFPPEINQLCVQLNKTYIEIANAVNNRTISLFTENIATINGENWFLNNQRNGALRQVYTLPSTIVNGSTIDIGFKITDIFQFTKNCYGSFTDGTNWYGLIYGSNVAIAGQVSFFIFQNVASTTTDQIKFLVGAGAPAIDSGTIVLEWISNVLNNTIN